MIPLVNASYEGFLQPFIINLILWAAGIGKITGCMGLGFWGLIFNDDGLLAEQCLNTGLVGGRPNFRT